MKPKLLKVIFLPLALCLFILLTVSCKKEKLDVNEVKEYFEVLEKAQSDLAGGAMQLTLNPDKTVDFVPGGDISYRGTYKISGSKIKVKTQQNSGSYIFEIISETEIKNKEFGTLLRLKQ
jgi:hypothetical protein